MDHSLSYKQEGENNTKLHRGISLNTSAQSAVAIINSSLIGTAAKERWKMHS